MTARRTVLAALLVAALGCAAVGGCSASAGAVATGGESTAGAPSEVLPAPEPTTQVVSPPPAPVYSEEVVRLPVGVAHEASGIAASVGTPGAYFLIDDDSVDSIIAVGSDGGVLATIAVDGMHKPYAEAISAGTCGATPLPDGAATQNCLYVGGIGDNSLVRDDIVLFRIAEPDLAAPPTEPVAADEWRYTYPDGPHNAESLMVAADGSLLVVTNPNSWAPARMYRAEPGGGELAFVREFTVPTPTIPLKTIFTGNVATDIAVAPGRVLLLTYDELNEYLAPDPAADLTGFPDWPHNRLPMPSMPQAEGVTAMVDGCGYVVASEAGPGGETGSLALVTCT